MSEKFSLSELQSAMEEISRANLSIQKTLLPLKKWEQQLSKCSCYYRSRAEDVLENSVLKQMSAHAQMELHARKMERNALIRAFHDRLMQVSCMHPEHARIYLNFGLTDSGNPAIDIRFENISVHERPVTPRTLAPKLLELLECLSRNNEKSGSVRRFMVAYTDRITAVSPEQAIWKWLCLRHRKTALRLKDLSSGSSIPDNEEFNKLLAGAAIHEVFETAPALASGLSLKCTDEQAAAKDHLW